MTRHMTNNKQNHFPKKLSVASNNIFVVLIVLFLSKLNFLLYVIYTMKLKREELCTKK